MYINKAQLFWDFAVPVVKTWCFQSWGHGFDPWLWTKMSHVVQHGQKVLRPNSFLCLPFHLQAFRGSRLLWIKPHLPAPSFLRSLSTLPVLGPIVSRALQTYDFTLLKVSQAHLLSPLSCFCTGRLPFPDALPICQPGNLPTHSSRPNLNVGSLKKPFPPLRSMNALFMLLI